MKLFSVETDTDYIGLGVAVIYSRFHKGLSVVIGFWTFFIGPHE